MTDHDCGTSRRLRAMLKDRDARLAEAEALLREAQHYVGNLRPANPWSEVSDLLDRIDAALGTTVQPSGVKK